MGRAPAHNYEAVESATLPAGHSQMNYTSNVTDYNDDNSGIDMLDQQQPKPLLKHAAKA